MFIVLLLLELKYSPMLNVKDNKFKFFRVMKLNVNCKHSKQYTLAFISNKAAIEVTVLPLSARVVCLLPSPAHCRQD